MANKIKIEDVEGIFEQTLAEADVELNERNNLRVKFRSAINDYIKLNTEEAEKEKKERKEKEWFGVAYDPEGTCPKDLQLYIFQKDMATKSATGYECEPYEWSWDELGTRLEYFFKDEMHKSKKYHRLNSFGDYIEFGRAKSLKGYGLIRKTKLPTVVIPVNPPVPKVHKTEKKVTDTVDSVTI